MPNTNTTPTYLNANLSQVPLSETERNEAALRELWSAYSQRKNLRQEGKDVLPNTVAEFTPLQLQAMKQIESLYYKMGDISKNPRIQDLINHSHAYKSYSDLNQAESKEARKRNPLETPVYSSYMDNPKFKNLRDIYRQEATEHFKRSVLPAVRSWHALHGSTHGSPRANAEAEELRKFNERISRDLTKMMSEQHEKAADYSMQNEQRGRDERVFDLAGHQANKQSYLNTAEAQRAADQNMINNEIKRAELIGKVGSAQQQLEHQKLMQEHARVENANEFESNAVRNLMTTAANLPPSAPTTTQISVQPHSLPVNPLSMLSGAAQQMYSHINPQQVPRMKRGGSVPHFEEGGVAPQIPNQGETQQQLPSMANVEYTPEQRIMLQMVEEYQKKSPLARMFETTGANQLAKVRESPVSAFGEGLLKHQENERTNFTSHANVIKSVSESRDQQQKLLAEMGIKKRENDIDESYKKGMVSAAQENARTSREQMEIDRIYKQEHAKQFSAEAELKNFELEKKRGTLGGKKLINEFGLEKTPNEDAMEQSLDVNPRIDGGLSNPKDSISPNLNTNDTEISVENKEQNNPSMEIQKARSALSSIRDARGPYGGAELSDKEKEVAHTELNTARALRDKTKEGLTILKEMNELNGKISTGTLLSTDIGMLKGIANNIRGNYVPWEKGTHAELDRFETLSNRLVGVQKDIDALTGTGKGASGIGIVNFLQSGKPGGNKATESNTEDIKSFTDKFKYMNDKTTFITRAVGEYYLTPDEASSIFDKIENSGINPIDVFETKKKSSKKETMDSVENKNDKSSKLEELNSRISKLQNEVGLN